MAWTNVTSVRLNHVFALADISGEKSAVNSHSVVLPSGGALRKLTQSLIQPLGSLLSDSYF